MQYDFAANCNICFRVFVNLNDIIEPVEMISGEDCRLSMSDHVRESGECW